MVVPGHLQNSTGRTLHEVGGRYSSSRLNNCLCHNAINIYKIYIYIYIYIHTYTMCLFTKQFVYITCICDLYIYIVPVSAGKT